MIDIALVGAGRIGAIHGANVRSHPKLRLKYVVDAVEASAEQLASRLGAVPASFDAAVADPGVGGIIVASSTDTHLRYSVGAVEAGKAVFCEKPLNLDLAAALGAGKALDRAGARFLLGFNRRFDPHFGRLHQRLRSGELGELETLHIISHDPQPPPIDYVKVSGGLFLDMAIHDFDMARWMLGEEPVEIYAAGSCLVDPAIGAAGDIDTAKCVLRTASGRLCVISNSRRSGYGYDQRIEAFCSKGVLRVDNIKSSAVEAWDEDGARSEPLQNFFLDRYRDAYIREIDHFAAVAESRAEPAIGYRDGIAAMKLAAAANESLERKAFVRLT